eukprot:1583459-Pyramimonas_sp.AAC.1
MNSRPAAPPSVVLGCPPVAALVDATRRGAYPGVSIYNCALALLESAVGAAVYETGRQQSASSSSAASDMEPAAPPSLTAITVAVGTHSLSIFDTGRTAATTLTKEATTTPRRLTNLRLLFRARATHWFPS